MTTRLKLYNKALNICSERELTALTDTVEPRYLLDSAWNDGAVNSCLAVADWRFATRSVSIDYDAGIDPAFGYQYAFAKPTDMITEVSLCVDEYFNSPLTEFFFEAGYWYADVDEIYLRYVSNDSAYGTNYADWPDLFSNFVAAYLASRIIKKLTSDRERREEVKDELKKTMSLAMNVDAKSGPPRQLPSGSWTRSRSGGGSREGGRNRNSLIG